MLPHYERGIQITPLYTRLINYEGTRAMFDDMSDGDGLGNMIKRISQRLHDELEDRDHVILVIKTKSGHGEGIQLKVETHAKGFEIMKEIKFSQDDLIILEDMNGEPAMVSRADISCMFTDGLIS